MALVGIGYKPTESHCLLKHSPSLMIKGLAFVHYSQLRPQIYNNKVNYWLSKSNIMSLQRYSSKQHQISLNVLLPIVSRIGQFCFWPQSSDTNLSAKNRNNRQASSVWGSAGLTMPITPGTLPLTCETGFLLLFVFLISSILHHPALLHRHTLILDRLLTFLVEFSILVLKRSFSQSLSLHRFYPFLGLISWNYDHSLFGSLWRCSIGKCGKLSQPSWLSVAHWPL